MMLPDAQQGGTAKPLQWWGFFFFIPFLQPRKLLLIHLISSYPPAQDTGSAASTFQSNFHVHSSRHFLLPGTLWPIPSQSPGCPGMLCPVLSSRDSPHHSSLPKPAQPGASSPGAAHQIPNGNLLAPSVVFPIIPSPMGHPKGVIKPLQKSPGDPPAFQREHSPQPIHGPGFPQEAPSPRNSSCAAPGGAQRAKISREEPNVPQFRVSRTLAGSGSELAQCSSSPCPGSCQGFIPSSQKSRMNRDALEDSGT